MRTVAPDLMRSAGGTRAEKYPQTTVFGVEPKVTSGLSPAGADCPAADDIRPAMPTAAKQITATPQTCFDIGLILSGNISAQHSIECWPRRKRAARERNHATMTCRLLGQSGPSSRRHGVLDAPLARGMTNSVSVPINSGSCPPRRAA
jgi:hypothetical protein